MYGESEAGMARYKNYDGNEAGAVRKKKYEGSVEGVAKRQDYSNAQLRIDASISDCNEIVGNSESQDVIGCEKIVQAVSHWWLEIFRIVV